MSDLISRQAAIEAFGLSEKTRKYGGDHSGYDTMMLYEIQNTLESLPSAPRWTPVSEGLPKSNEEDELGFLKAYLVQDGRWMDVARWDGKYWVAWGYGIALNNVTAWMSLPEPWKGEDND